MCFFHHLKLNNCSLDTHLAYTNLAKIKETRLKSIQDSELMLFQGAFSTCFFKISVFSKMAHSKWLDFSKVEPRAIFNDFITRLLSSFG